MKAISTAALSLLIIVSSNGYGAEQQVGQSADACPSLLDHEFRLLADQQQQRLCDSHRGKVILVVNTASKCGYTYQYEGLEQLYRDYRDQGLVVLGFPSNDFGSQEPGGEEQIQLFCRDMFSIDFPMYQKIHAAKGRAHPFIRGLAEQAGSYPRWNFHKYLLDRDGNLVGSWSSEVEPEASEIVRTVKRYL